MLLIFLCLFPMALAQDEYTFDTKYVEIPVNHFTFTDNSTFQLKYLVNDTYFGQNGTIFIYTGNEGEIEMVTQNSGFIFEIASQFNALIVFAEHRYYGKSLPFGNQSYASPEYMGSLSSTQALRDFVYLINELQKLYAKDTDVKKIPAIALGGSYGGMLAAWLKIKYPDSVIGALASSAPIWMFKDQNPCDSLYTIISDDFETLGSTKCRDTIAKSWEIIRTFTQDEAGKKKLADSWKLCSTFETDTITSWLSVIYTVLAQTNYPYPADYVVPLPANPVQEFCKILDTLNSDDANDLVTTFGDALQVYTNYTGSTECNNFQAKESQRVADYVWGFQACTEMIMPICSTDADMFENSEFDFEAYSNDCFETYGVRPRSEEVPITEYGDKDLSTANNIIFSNGLQDPWSGFGVTDVLSGNVAVVSMADGAHISDLRAGNDQDPDSVKQARLIEIYHFQQWLDEYYQSGK
ncbi:hypothetical protein NQ315_007085 [Exocentrus adspersus]|uniref:Lysosomal Pro-X carboxypeptidase n=1 Tax=Exocentrus adspersus TaxID=1586481 RepID=A0AAV8WDL2_9CUCU|nr:hypothetical protein NQ315_007085 [Exocentrus adspersus]